MKNKMKIILMILIVFAMVVSGCSAGMYKPGNLKDQTVLTVEQLPGNDFWEIDTDVQLYRFEQKNRYQEEGIPVLVLHGGPGMPPESPWPGMEVLAQTHPVFYYHQRGCGLSSRPVDTFSSGNFYKNAQLLEESLGLTAQIADIERIRQILNRDKLILVGHSFGGFIAALYAAEYPERVEKLVLIEPANVVVFPRTGHDLFSVIEENLLEEQLKAEYREFLADYMNFKDLFSHSEAALRQQNSKLGWYYSLIFEDKKQLGEMPPEEWVGGWMVQALYMSMGQKHDYRAFLSRISAETLIIQGSRDRLKMERKNPYTESIKSVQVVELDSGHHPAREIPGEFSAILLPFID